MGNSIPTKNLKLFEILVPASMEGTKIPIPYHRQWDKFVVKLTGGVTILSKAVGQWGYKDSEESVIDPLIPVRIVCTEEQINDIIDFTIRHYRQEAIMAYEISQNAIIKHRNDK